MKPTREQLEQDLLSYVEGTLSPADAARVEVYLSNTDPKLTSQILGMLADRNQLQSLPKLRAPHDMAERIMEHVERSSLLGAPEQEIAPTPHHPPHRKYAAAAAIFLLVGSFGYVVYKMIERPDNTLDHAVVSSQPNNHTVAFNNAVGDPSHESGDGDVGKKLVNEKFAAPEERKQQIELGAEKGTLSKEGANVVKADEAATDSPGAARQAETPANGTPATAPSETLRVALHAPNADNQPLYLTLASHTPSDAQRLRALLETYVAADESLAYRAHAAAEKADASPSTTNPPAAAELAKDLAKDKELEQKLGQASIPAPGSVRRDTASGVAASQQGQALAELQEPIITRNNVKAAYPQNAKRNAATVTFTGSTNAPYRVLLRQNQLDELTTRFSVVAVNRGLSSAPNNEFANSTITANGAVANSTNGANTYSNLSPANAGPAGSPTPSNYQYSANNSTNNNNTELAPSPQPPSPASARPTPAAPVPAAAPAIAASKDGQDATNTKTKEVESSPWVECIITLLPATEPAPKPTK